MPRKHLKSSCGLVTHTNKIRIDLLVMWLYKSYRDFILEVTGTYTQKRSSVSNASDCIVNIIPGSRNSLKLSNLKWPPVIVGHNSQMKDSPMLEGRHRQQLPQVPGRIPEWLLAGKQNNENFSQKHLAAWFVPCRIGMDRTMHISFKSGTVIRFDVSEWPAPYDDQQIEQIRRAANILQAAPDAFATVSSIAKAYKNLEKIWIDCSLGKKDPQVELLIKHARQLPTVFEDLRARPRAILKTEHRMQKLQNVRRIDAKTLQWLLAQPGRNTAERAGSRQRIKAPRRYETICTLENQVLRAFAALTVRTTKALPKNTPEIAPYKAILEAHCFRARQIETMLRERNVPEAHPHVRPNFPLRYDPRYQKIWHAWQALRRESSATELDWMWQHRTFMELLGLRAAMLFFRRTCNPPNNGIIAHHPVLGASGSMQNQGCHLDSDGIQATYRILHDGSKKDGIYEFRTVNLDDDLPLGALTSIDFSVNSSRENALLWYGVPEYSDNGKCSIGVGAFPWDAEHKRDSIWDSKLNEWINWLVP